MSLRLTIELSWHHVSVSAKRSRSKSTISSKIKCSLLLIDREFKRPHFVPQQVFNVFGVFGLGGVNLLFMG